MFPSTKKKPQQQQYSVWNTYFQWVNFTLSTLLQRALCTWQVCRNPPWKTISPEDPRFLASGKVALEQFNPHVRKYLSFQYDIVFAWTLVNFPLSVVLYKQPRKKIHKALTLNEVTTKLPWSPLSFQKISIRGDISSRHAFKEKNPRLGEANLCSDLSNHPIKTAALKTKLTQQWCQSITRLLRNEWTCNLHGRFVLCAGWPCSGTRMTNSPLRGSGWKWDPRMPRAEPAIGKNTVQTTVASKSTSQKTVWTVSFPTLLFLNIPELQNCCTRNKRCQKSPHSSRNYLLTLPFGLLTKIIYFIYLNNQ